MIKPHCFSIFSSTVLDERLPEVDFFRPEGGQLLTEAQLIDPVLSVDQWRRNEIAPETKTNVIYIYTSTDNKNPAA